MHRRTLPPARRVTSPTTLLPSLPERGQPLPQVERDADARGGAAGPRHARRRPGRHFVLGTPLEPPFPDGIEPAIFGMGCFWGAERKFWQAARRLHDRRRLRGRLHAEPDLRGGVHRPHRPHRGRARRLRPGARRATRRCCKVFWEGHDPTQGMRQGNDVGTQYRSAIYSTTRARSCDAALASRDVFQQRARARRATRPITTEIARGRRRSTTPRTTTSSTSRRTRTATAGSAAPASRCPIGVGVSAAH